MMAGHNNANKVNFLMGLPQLRFLRQDPEIKEQITDCLDLGKVSVAGMSQVMIRILFFDPGRPNTMCVYKAHKTSCAWVHTARGTWIQVENGVFVARLIEWIDSALSGHMYVDGFDPSKRHDSLSSLRDTCLQYGLVRTAMSIEDVLEMDHINVEDLTTHLTTKQRSEFEDIVMDYVFCLSKTIPPPPPLDGTKCGVQLIDSDEEHDN